MKTHRESEAYSYQHTRARMWERHGLPLSLEEYRSLNTSIRGMAPIDIEEAAGEIQSIYQTEYREKIVRVVYSFKRNRITTVLP